jgi:hypothetical protein
MDPHYIAFYAMREFFVAAKLRTGAAQTPVTPLSRLAAAQLHEYYALHSDPV